VTLNLDTTLPIRSLPRQRELVVAIRDAPASTQETNWLEWKSAVDLSDKQWQAEMSRQILGMANRDPDVAARAAGGCGFVVVGVSPGSLVGTRVFDSANIDAWLTPYVGTAPDAPQWAPAYVEVDGSPVLILTVEPPRLGDRAWPCRKSYTPDTRTGIDPKVTVRDGAVFVRHEANTREASGADQDMLARRAAGGQRRIAGISLIVALSCRAAALDVSDEAIAAWTDRERRATTPPPPEPPRPPASGQPTAARTPMELTKQIAEQMADLQRVLATTGFVVPDDRTPEAYQKEVNAYIERGAKVLRPAAIRRACARKLGKTDFSVRNDTDNPIHGLQVEVIIAGEGIVALADEDVPDIEMPKRPRMLGTPIHRTFDPLAGIRLPNYGISSDALRSVRRGVRIDYEHSARLTFDAVDLYPEDEEDLDSVFLLVHPTYAGQSLAGKWMARAKDIRGVVRDSIEIAVDPKVWTIDELLTGGRASADDGEAEGDA
jgi:hypothetical protein